MPSATTEKTKRRKKKRKPRKLSHLYKPEDLSLEEWQIGLRRQFGREQKFKFENLGTDPIFSEFQITNPQTRNTYRVTIRGMQSGENFFARPDFATKRAGDLQAYRVCAGTAESPAWREGGGLREGFQPDYSQVLLKYGARPRSTFSSWRFMSGKAHCPCQNLFPGRRGTPTAGVCAL